MKRSRDIALFLWCYISLLTGELVLRLFCFGAEFFGAGLLFCFLAPLAPSVLLAALCPMLGKAGKWICSIVLIIFYILFGSQLIYYDLFKTFYTLFSMLHGGMVISFFPIIMAEIWKNLWLLFIMLAPAVLFMIFYRMEPKSGLKRALCGAGIALLCHLVMLLCLLPFGTGFMTPYDLYFKTISINESFEKLGLENAMRLDAVRFVTGFKETPKNGLQALEQTPEGKNMLELDLSPTGDETTNDISVFIKSRKATDKNEYTGLFEGKNLILIVAESFSPYVIDPELTPTLYKLSTEGFRFNDFYTPLWGVSTIDGEYAVMTGLYPKTGTWSMWESSENLLPYSPGNVFSALGYKTLAFHDHDGTYYHRDQSHFNLGFDFKAVGMGLELTDHYPESDLEMIDRTTAEYLDSDQPFCVYYLTMSGHMLYDFDLNDMSAKNRSKVESLGLNETVSAYIACQLELESAMTLLVERLEDAGQLENTVIALVPDHYPYVLSHEQMQELAGRELSKDIDVYRSVCILYNSETGPIEVDAPCANIDLLPTLLNLFGVEYDSRLLMGSDVFGTDEHLVVFASRSFVTDDGSYVSHTGKTDLPADKVERLLERINREFAYSARILENDYYRKIMVR